MLRKADLSSSLSSGDVCTTSRIVFTRTRRNLYTSPTSLDEESDGGLLNPRSGRKGLISGSLTMLISKRCLCWIADTQS